MLFLSITALDPKILATTLKKNFRPSTISITNGFYNIQDRDGCFLISHSDQKILATTLRELQTKHNITQMASTLSKIEIVTFQSQ